jgi:hypothetical protein
LDAQYFGLAQRRKRVFVVASAGAGADPAEILFERESVPWNNPPRRETGPDVAATLTRGADSGSKGGYAGRRREDDLNIVVNCLDRSMGNSGPDDNAAQANHLVACALTGNPYGDHESRESLLVPFIFETRIGRNGRGQPSEVAHALRGAEAGETSDMRPCVVTENRYERNEQGGNGEGEQMGKACSLFLDHGEAFLDVAKCNVEFAKIGKIKGGWISTADRMSAIGQHTRRGTDRARPIARAGAVGGADIQRHTGHAKASASVMGASAQK